MKIITISREYASGGHTIGQRVAKELGIEFYDKDIVRETVKASGFDQELIASEEEDITRTDSILRNILGVSYPDTREAIHDVQGAIILRLAQRGPCVILGRCADEIFRKAGIDSLNVFIHADDLHRAVRASELSGSKNATELQRLMAKRDASRHAYYTHYTGKRWGDCRNYHLTLDSGILGYDLCVRMIVEAARAE